MSVRLLLVAFLAPAAALAQGGSIACESVPTYYPRGDHWAIQPGEIIYYAIHSSGSADVSNGADLAAVQRAFGTWMGHSCAGGGQPNLDIGYGGTTSSRSRGDTYDGDGNLSSVSHVVYWLESGWPADSQTVALTTNLFVPGTGVLVTSDMEFNGQNWQWRARATPGGASTGCSTTSATCYDIETVAVHEAGHFIGLNHVDCTDALMFAQGAGSLERTALSIHEQTALCNLYPPRPGTVGTERYTGEQCSADDQCPDGLCIFPTGLEGTGWGWCTKHCDCTDGCAANCPQAFVCAWQGGNTIEFCKPGVHLTGGATTGGCACDTGGGCQSGCICDPDCTGCSTSSDCTDGRVCVSQSCINCTSSSQCSGGKVCLAGRCALCTSSYQCSATKVCAAGACTDCTTTAQCLGQVCIGGDCLDCTSNSQCDGGRVCSGGRCEDCVNSGQCGGLVCVGGRCSACSSSCPNGQVCISGSCQDCSSSSQCADGLVCSSGRCNSCTSSSQCVGGQVCASAECGPCIGSSQCGSGQVCAAGACTGCSSSAQCTGGQVCLSGSCSNCTQDSQCAIEQVCDPFAHRCVTAPDSGGGSVDPDTGLALDFGSPCNAGAQCASGTCITDGDESRCTQACVPGGLPGGGTPDESCPGGFDCMATDFSSFVCWPLDPAAWDGAITQSKAILNELCFAENGANVSDDWYLACAPDLFCFGFVPRCEGQEGACVRYCNGSVPCPEPNQVCCYDVNASGNCVGPGPGRIHGGCFEVRIEGESCVAAEQSICDNGMGCYHFGNPALAKCYRRCAGAPCLPGASCNGFSDGCGNDFDLCCADAELPATCSPGRAQATRLDLGFACNGNNDCDSDLCASYAGQSGCSRSCNSVTGVGCPDETYDADGDGRPDGGFDCIEGAAGTGFCWPRQGPLAVEIDPEPEPEPEDDGPPPPKGLCAAAGGHGWLLLLFVAVALRRRRS